MIGETISHYQIVERLGEGGMGVVYKAWDTKLERHVALKFLSPRLLSRPADVARFKREAQAAAGIDHANVCAVHAIETVDERTFIVMAYVAGHSLDELIESGPMPTERALNLAAQITKGLARAHRKGIVHRDVKPANVRVTPEDEVKVVDFGLARATDRTRLTQSGMSVGTVAYMSPEQALGNEIDARSDIFSLGIVLYEMLTGRPPFKGDVDAALLYGIVNVDPPSLVEAGIDVPTAVQEIVDRMLAKDPDERYTSADEVAKDIGRALRGSEPELRIRPRRAWRRVAIVATTIAVLAAAVWLIPWPDGDPGRVSAAENRIAVMPFSNMVDPADASNLGDIASTLLTTGLSQSEILGVVSSQRVRDLIAAGGGSGSSPPSMEVATQTGARWMIEGNILQTQPVLVIATQLVDVHSGDVISSQRITGAPEEAVFALVDRLIGAIARDPALPTAGAHAEYALVSDVTTNSDEAYRLYLEGITHQAAFRDEAAKSALVAAVEEDTTFAMAYLALSRVRTASHAEKNRALAAAVRHASRLNMRERNYVESRKLLEEGDVAGAIEKLEEIIEVYPDDKHAVFSLGTIYMVPAGNQEKALAYLERACELDPRNKHYWNQLAYLRQWNGDYDGAIDAINRAIAISPDEFAWYDTRGDLYSRGGNLERAIASYSRALELNPGYWETIPKLGYTLLFAGEFDEARSVFARNLESEIPRARSAARAWLARIPLFHGRLGDGALALEETAAAFEADNLIEDEYIFALFTLSIVQAKQGHLDRAIRTAERIIEHMTHLYPDVLVDYRDVLVQYLCRDGQTERADSILVHLDALVPETSGKDRAYLDFARGLCHMERGDYDAALEHLKASEGWAFFMRYPQGVAYLKAGLYADATETLEGATRDYSFYRALDPIASTEAYYHLGRAYEESGWNERAIAEYERFLDTWENADPGIDSIEDARLRLARLSQ